MQIRSWVACRLESRASSITLHIREHCASTLSSTLVFVPTHSPSALHADQDHTIDYIILACFAAIVAFPFMTKGSPAIPPCSFQIPHIPQALILPHSSPSHPPASHSAVSPQQTDIRLRAQLPSPTFPHLDDT